MAILIVHTVKRSEYKQRSVVNRNKTSFPSYFAKINSKEKENTDFYIGCPLIDTRELEYAIMKLLSQFIDVM